MYGIEINVSGVWKPLCPPPGGPPYSFGSKAEAETMARILYPAMYGGDLVRIVPAVSASCAPELADFIDPRGALRKAGLLRVS